MEAEAKTGFAEVPIDIEPVEDVKPKNNWKLIALVSGASVLVAVLALFMLWPSKDGDQRIPQPGGTSVTNPVPEPLQDDATGSKYKFPSAPPPSPFDADDVNEVEMPSISPAASSIPIPMKEKDGSETEADDDSEEDDNNNDRESIDGNADSKDLYFDVDAKDDPICEAESDEVEAGEVDDIQHHSTTIPISYPSPEDFKYHQSYSFEDRRAEVQNVLSELPDAVPVVAQVFNHPELDGYTGVLNPDLPVATAKLLLLPKFNASEQGCVMRIFVDGVECADDLEIGKIAEEHRNEDGNVYLACTIERLDSSPTKLLYSFFQRRSFNEHVRKQLPDTTPVIIEADNGLLFYWAADQGSTVHDLKHRFKAQHGISPFILIHLFLSNGDGGGGAVLGDDEALVSDIHRENAELDGNVYLTCTIFDPLPFSFKQNFSFDERCQRAQQILTQHPADIPVVLEFFYPHSPSPFFYHLPTDLTIADFKHHLTERFASLSPVRLTGHQGVELEDSLCLAFVYAQCKDEDGFLYLSVFGISAVDVEADKKVIDVEDSVDVEESDEAVEEAADVEESDEAVEAPVSKELVSDIPQTVPIVRQTVPTHTFPQDAHPSIFTYFQQESTASRTANATQELQRYPDSVLLCLEVFNYLPQRTYYLQSRKRSLRVSKLKLELCDTLDLPHASVLKAYSRGQEVGDDEELGELWDRFREEDENLYLAFTVKEGNLLEEVSSDVVGVVELTIKHQTSTFPVSAYTCVTLATLINHLRSILYVLPDHRLHLSINGTELFDTSARISDVISEHASTDFDCTIKPIFEDAFIGSFKKSISLETRKEYFAHAMQEHPDSLVIVLELDPTGLPLPTITAPLRFLALKGESFTQIHNRIVSLLLAGEPDKLAELRINGLSVEGEAMLGPVYEQYASKEDGGLYLGLFLRQK